MVTNATPLKRGVKKTILDGSISVPVETGDNKPLNKRITRKKLRAPKARLISNIDSNNTTSDHRVNSLGEIQNNTNCISFRDVIKTTRTRKPNLGGRKVTAKQKSTATRIPKSTNKGIKSSRTLKIRLGERKVTAKQKSTQKPKSTKKIIRSPQIPTVFKTEENVKKQETSRRISSRRSTEITRTSKQHTPLPELINAKTADTMVLTSDQFIFRPKIPITEENYPLENTDKTDIFEHDSSVDNVLSYGFTDPAIKQYIKFPSVSKIIEETISEKTKLVLGNWRKKMIDDLGEDGFYKHNEDLKTRGTEFHMAVRNAVLGKTTENCTEVTQNSLKSLSWMLEHISNPKAVESTIAHPKLGYRGVADCIATFRNIPVIIDWKLSDKPKRDLKDTYDAPVQITAYIGAMNHDPNYKWGVNHGLVAVAYANGDPCDVFLLAPKHCQIYWRHWLMRFDKFKDSDVGRRWMQRSQYKPQNNYYGKSNNSRGQTRFRGQNNYRGQNRNTRFTRPLTDNQRPK